jgi:fumarate hydratase class II
MPVTALNPDIGYDTAKAAAITPRRRIGKDPGVTLLFRHVATRAAARSVVKPDRMIGPNG